MSLKHPLAFLLLISLPTLTMALTSDRNQPIHIQADRVEIDESRRVSVYTGDVALSQGSFHLSAQTLIVHRNETSERIEAQGDPVTFRQRPDNADHDIQGQARTIDYHAGRATVELSGEARLWQDKDEFSGQRILYELDNNRVVASRGGDTRVRAVIHPKTNGEQQ